MIRKIRDYVKYTTSELDNYTKIPGTCITKINKEFHINFPPYGLGSFKTTLLRIIAEKKIGSYDEDLLGIILDVRIIKVLGNVARLRFDDPTLHINVKADCYVFNPKIGTVVRGLVKHISSRHIGVIIYRVFNVSIRLSTERNENTVIKLNSEIEFRIKNFDLQNLMPYIEGELIAKEMPLKHEFFDSESDEENENSPSTSFITKKSPKKELLSQSNDADDDEEIIFSDIYHLKPDEVKDIEKGKVKEKKKNSTSESNDDNQIKLAKINSKSNQTQLSAVDRKNSSTSSSDSDSDKNQSKNRKPNSNQANTSNLNGATENILLEKNKKSSKNNNKNTTSNISDNSSESAQTKNVNKRSSTSESQSNNIEKNNIINEECFLTPQSKDSNGHGSKALYNGVSVLTPRKINIKLENQNIYNDDSETERYFQNDNIQTEIKSELSTSKKRKRKSSLESTVEEANIKIENISSDNNNELIKIVNNDNNRLEEYSTQITQKKKRQKTISETSSINDSMSDILTKVLSKKNSKITKEKSSKKRNSSESSTINDAMSEILERYKSKKSVDNEKCPIIFKQKTDKMNGKDSLTKAHKKSKKNNHVEVNDDIEMDNNDISFNSESFLVPGFSSTIIDSGRKKKNAKIKLSF